MIASPSILKHTDAGMKSFSGTQQSLFQYKNPLLQCLSADFFKNVPRTAGIYLMKSARGDVLYIGKAKNLRARLNSYKNARPSNVSRKVLRMLKLVREIEIRNCTDETAALLLENRLLRTEKPPFNVLNTRPENYYFIRMSVLGTTDAELFGERGDALRVQFQLTSRPPNQVDENLVQLYPAGKANRVRVYGVFKSRGRTSEAFASLLRLLLALQAKDDSFSFPTSLMRVKAPRSQVVEIPEVMFEKLCDFLHGRSQGFLNILVQNLLGAEGIPRFIHHVIEEDLKQLQTFYKYGPKRNARLKKMHGIKRRAIAQDEIDDLLVLTTLSRKRPKSKTT